MAHITASLVRGAEVVNLRGEADMVDEGLISSTLQACVERSSLTVVDTTDLTFMDSTTARSILDAARAARREGHDLVTCIPLWGSAPVRRLFFDVLSAESEKVSVVPSVEAAIRRSERRNLGGLGERARDVKAQLWRELHKHETLVKQMEEQLFRQRSLSTRSEDDVGGAAM